MGWKRVESDVMIVGDTILRSASVKDIENIGAASGYRAGQDIKDRGPLDPSTNWRLVMEWRLEKME